MTTSEQRYCAWQDERKLEAVMAEYPQLLHTGIDTTEHRALAEFYRQLLGLRYRPGDEPPKDGYADDTDWLVLVDPNGARKLAFQQGSALAQHLLQAFGGQMLPKFLQHPQGGTPPGVPEFKVRRTPSLSRS